MKTLQIKAVIITDGESYFIHGVSGETPPDMFRAMAPLWSFDPSRENVHYIEVEVTIPEYEKKPSKTK